jgi:hypothetical protein
MKTAFLSSTARDLAEYRDAAYKAIEGLDDWHCRRMEDFGARDGMANEFCREKVSECDVFVGIVGHCYGSSPKGSEKSYTEQEYDAAIATDKPRLMFLAPEDFPLPAYLIEPDERRAKQRAFRDRVNAERIRDTFTSPEDLAGRVRQAIYNWVQEQATVEERPSARPEGVLPLPPQPYFAHPFALQRNFTGRARERRELTEWFTSDTHPMLAYIAIGGMGKSTLTWAWLQRDVLGLPLPGVAEKTRSEPAASVPEASRPEGVIWWSFYERESTFQKFLDQALTYASGGRIDPKAILSIRERMQALYNLLCQRRFLVVLDGVERILRAYTRLDTAYRGDTFEKDKRGDFRACTDPNAGTFLQWLASGAMKSKVLLTGRLFPRELDGLAGCQRMNLSAFDLKHAVAFFHAQGVKGARAEIQEACAAYGYHPLALRLLTAILISDPEYLGRIGYADRINLIRDEASIQDMLVTSYERLSAGGQLVLNYLNTMPQPARLDDMCAATGVTNRTSLKAILKELREHGFIYFDSRKSTYLIAHDLLQDFVSARIVERRRVPTPGQFEYDVALSFAGEDRPIAQKLAYLLRERGIRVFYDEFEKAHLWGTNLYDYLTDLYRDRARYCIIFVSEHYERKAWTKVERQAAQARAFLQEKEYILPIQLNDIKLTGMPETVGYIDMRETRLEEIAELIIKKLG